MCSRHHYPMKKRRNLSTDEAFHWSDHLSAFWEWSPYSPFMIDTPRSLLRAKLMSICTTLPLAESWWTQLSHTKIHLTTHTYHLLHNYLCLETCCASLNCVILHDASMQLISVPHFSTWLEIHPWCVTEMELSLGSNQVLHLVILCCHLRLNNACMDSRHFVIEIQAAAVNVVHQVSICQCPLVDFEKVIDLSWWPSLDPDALQPWMTIAYPKDPSKINTLSTAIIRNQCHATFKPDLIP